MARRRRHRLSGARRWAPTVLVALFVVVVLGVAVATLLMPRQVRSYLTHWRGSPTATVPYGPFPVEGAPRVLLAVAGDVGYDSVRLAQTATGVIELDERHPYDALLLLGDNAYPRGEPRALEGTVFGPFASVLAHAEVLAILGNHDVMDGHADDQVRAFGMPGRWWSVQLGDVLIIGLDSNLVDDDRQLAWLERTLRSSTAPWKIVAVHHPPYSAGYQGSALAVRRRFSPVFAQYGVQLVLSGHDHDYQRSDVIDGVTYVVSGGASLTRRTGSESFTATSFSWHHFVEVAVFDRALVVRAINQDLRVADEAVIPLTTR